MLKMYVWQFKYEHTGISITNSPTVFITEQQASARVLGNPSQDINICRTESLENAEQLLNGRCRYMAFG